MTVIYLSVRTSFVELYPRDNLLEMRCSFGFLTFSVVWVCLYLLLVVAKVSLAFGILYQVGHKPTCSATEVG